MSKARDTKLDQIQPGLGERIRRALGMTKDELDAAGVQSKSFEAVMTRADVEDVLVAAVNNVLAAADGVATKAADDEEPEALDVRQVVKSTLDDFMEIPTVSLDTAEDLLAVEEDDDTDNADDIPAGEDANTDAVDHEHHEHAPVDVPASEKALQQSVAFNEQLMDDQAALVQLQTEMVEQLKSLNDLPAAVESLTETVAAQAQQIEALKGQFAQRPRASVASETVADDDLVAKALQDAEDVDDFIPRANR